MSIFTEFKFSKSIEENLLRTVHCFERHLICESRSRISHTFVTINKQILIIILICGYRFLSFSYNQGSERNPRPGSGTEFYRQGTIWSR